MVKEKSSIILPLVGLSSRFSTSRPKWMLTHPDGRLMVEHALEGFSGRVYAGVRSEHEEKFNASNVLTKCFGGRVSVVVLSPTSSHGETVKKIIEHFCLEEEPIIVRDCDNKLSLPLVNGNSWLAVSGKRKGFDDSNKGWINNDYFSVGVYSFNKGSDFLKDYEDGKSLPSYYYEEVVISNDYSDWGTQTEWDEEVSKYKTYFIDLDGVVFYNSSKYFEPYWEDSEPIQANVDWINDLPIESTIMFITARTDDYYEETFDYLKELFPTKDFVLITGLPHSQRIIINDKSPNANHDACVAINTVRNEPI